MKNKIQTHGSAAPSAALRACLELVEGARLTPGKLYPVLLLAILLSLVIFTIAYAANISSSDKYAWAANGGWLNFNPAHGGGVTVYSDHLEGYLWAENAGWVRLGTHDSGGAHTYANDAAGTYGVNNDGVGNLSGYAWGTNVGWINLNPAHGGVTVDPVTGDFDGYAWGENVGWISFNGAAQDAAAYKTSTAWRGGLTAAYQNGIAALITTRRPGPAQSEGLTIADNGFLQDAGDGIIFGHNNAAFAVVGDNLGSVAAEKRWADVWQLDVHDGAGAAGGQVQLTFDISDAGGNAGNPFSASGTYYLLKRATGSAGDFAEVDPAPWSVTGDQLTFTVDAANLGSEFTLGAAADSPTAITLQRFAAHPGGDPVWFHLGILVLALGGAALVWRLRRATSLTSGGGR